MKKFEDGEKDEKDEKLFTQSFHWTKEKCYFVPKQQKVRKTDVGEKIGAKKILRAGFEPATYGCPTQTVNLPPPTTVHRSTN